MSQQLIERARLLACHAWVFRRAPACEYDALHVWWEHCMPEGWRTFVLRSGWGEAS